MNKELEKLRELCAKLGAPKPWNEDNFQLYSHLNQSSDYRLRHPTKLPTPEGDRNGYVYEVGISNIATLIAGGASIRRMTPAKRKACTVEAAHVAWALHEGCFLWETAAITNARELTDVLKVAVPLGKLWEKAYTGLMSRA